MKVKVVVIALAAVLLSSCRSWVLEDRIMCPRFLFFRVANSESFTERERVYATVFNYPDGYFIDKDTTSMKDINDLKFFFTLRGELAVQGYGLIGFRNQTVDEDQKSWRIQFGRDADPLFRFSYQQETEEESFIVPVEFVKDHSKVNVQFVGIETFESAEGQFPFQIVVTSNTCGIDALTGLPIRGPFQYVPDEEQIGHFSFILPRQGDHSLKMEIHGKPGVYELTGLIETFDFYQMLSEKANITWEEKNLPDLDITIDYQELSVRVEVIAWEQQELGYDF